MCETGKKCRRRNTFWVQSRRPVAVKGDASVGVEPFTTSGVSRQACGVCLARAVREVGKVNDDAAGGVSRPATDGVVVKRQVSPDIWR
jgi:hypothetical protein